MSSSVSEHEVDAYLAAALWTSNDESDESGGRPLDENFDVDDFSEAARAQARSEMESFWREASFVIDALEKDGEDVEWGGWPTDFWLTRNGHGVGFWDKEDEYGPAADPLSEIARRFGERYVMIDRRLEDGEETLELVFL